MASYVQFKHGVRLHFLGIANDGQARTLCNRRIRKDADIIVIDEQPDSDELCWSCLTGGTWNHYSGQSLYPERHLYRISVLPVPALQPTLSDLCEHTWQPGLLDMHHRQCAKCGRWEQLV